MKNKKLVVIVSLLLVAALCLALAACNKGSNPTQLNAPVITLDSATGTVSWKKVEHADSYDVKVNTNAAINVTGTSYTFDSSTAVGSYDVTVVAKSSDTDKYSASNPSNKVTYVKQDGGGEGRVLSQLSLLQEPTKSEYFLDEKATEVDFDGATFRAKYEDNSTKNLALSEVIIGSYTMPQVAGDFDVTVSYTENNVTKELPVTFTLRARTEADVDVNGVEIIPNSVDADNYVVANKEVTTVVKMDGTVLTATADDSDPQAVKTTVVKTDLTLGRNLLSVTDSQGDTELVLVVVGTLIENAAQFNAIAGDIANSQGKYYVVTRDLDFENTWHDPIGTAPLVASGDASTQSTVYTPTTSNDFNDMGTFYNEDTSAVDAIQNQHGVAFLGTIDGLGHTIMNYKIDKTSWRPEGYGIAMFGWLGENGKICNLNLRNVSVAGGGYTSILVGVNSGAIENVSIEETCVVAPYYHHGAAFVGYNFGTIKNVVSLVSRYSTNYEQNVQLELAYTATGDADTSVTRGFIGSGNHASALGGGWRYFDGIGTLYVTPSYVRINTTDNELAVSADELELDVIMQENDYHNVEVNFHGDYAALLTYDWDGGKLHVKLANYGAPQHPSGIEVPMSVSGSGTTATFTVKILPAYVTGYEFCNSDNITIDNFSKEVTQGLELDPDSIYILRKYSSNMTETIHPTRLDGYNKNGTVGAPQTVKAFYGAGDNDYLTFTVTLLQKQVTSIAMATQPTQASYTIGTDNDLLVDGATITVNYNNDTNETIPVTLEMIDGESYNLTAANAYNVQVTYRGQSCTFPITVNDAAVTVTSIAIVGDPSKSTYKIGETISADRDLKGATITATLSKGEPMTGIAITDAMISNYDFTTAGSATITVTYEGRTDTIDVTVVDYATALVVAPKTALDFINDIPQLTYSKATALDLKGAADYTLTMASGATDVAADISKISASGTETGKEAGQHEITYTYTDDYATVTAKQTYDIWYNITGDAVEEWAVIQGNLAGYYRLTKDLNFQNSSEQPREISPIGQAPVSVVGDVRELNVDEDNSALTIAPFIGKFDGAGYVIKNAKINFAQAPWHETSYCKALFSYIGEGAEVGNFTLKNINVRAGRYGAFVAGYNKGTISNIVIESDCVIYNQYDECFAAAGRSYGTIMNIVCHVTLWESADKEDNALQIVGSSTPRVTNCFMSNAENFLTASAVLGEVAGWDIIPSYGPVYGHYAIITSMGTEMTLDGELEIELYFDGERNVSYWIWPAAINNTVVGKIEYVSGHTYKFTFTDTGTLAVGSTFALGVNVAGIGYAKVQDVTIVEQVHL